MKYGSQSMVAPLKRVIVKSPENAFCDQATIDRQWKELNFVGRPDFAIAVQQHRDFADILRANGAEVLFLSRDDRTNLDSIYTHDPGIVTDHGAIVFQTGKELRRGEAPAMADDLERWGIPILGKIDRNGVAEGGDTLWLDHDTLLIGQGFRTNDAAIKSIRSMLEPHGVQVLAFHLPYGTGPADVLHLQSVISMLDEDLAVVYKPMMPVPMFQLLQERNMKMVDVAEEEFLTLGCNILAMSPGNILMAEGNPITKSRLEAAGCKVTEFAGSDIAYKGSGGPTCLTRPLLRT